MKTALRLTAVLLTLWPLTPFCQKANNYQIHGQIDGLGEDSVTIVISNYNSEGLRQSSDTLQTQAVSGRFYFEGKIDRPRFVWAQFGNPKLRRSVSFFIEKGDILIRGTIDSAERLSVTGTPSNNDLFRVHAITNKIYDRVAPLRLQLRNEKEGSERYKQLVSAMALKFDSIDHYEIDFNRSHPNSFASSVFLYVKQDKVPVEELEQLYQNLDADVKKADPILTVPQKIKAKKSVQPGNYAPDFASFDTHGKKVKLSDFKGKYVLLEFWASWCVPCRQQSPHLVDLYRKYGPKGFTIVQYSIDDKSAENKWKEAIDKDGLVWTQLSDLSGFDSKVTKLYGVQPIPDNFLIGPDGIIIARGLQGKALEDKLEQLLER